MKETRPLYHFTRSIEYLSSILKVGFNHRNPNESLPFRGAGRGGLQDFMLGFGMIDSRMQVPIVCFCDMDLSDTDEHSDQYGHYALGLTKEWARRNHITPARYIHESSPDVIDATFYNASDMLHAIVGTQKPPSIVCAEHYGVDKSKVDQAMIEMLSELDSTIIEYAKYIVENVALLRAYEGEWTDRTTGNKTNRIFYDEREWRSVGDPDPDHNLRFHKTDITDILLKREDERKEIVSHIIANCQHLDFKDEDEVKSLIRIKNE